mmetsp:Transcript_18612/g.46185  ORF Transcript_18612/g.46185 Transcript_18612/m.46185 type:complete len:297 (-) Transcript_18612:123-1013(-)|eukprot:CAMPEP_0116096284 /NCGR_PEP_ID=MMETSP0327-20121206/10103_1 /TAXON_ID=44447 /ORGANISM="Pseudo-nitzschia delicatissima, Strain B596" /LENGTH=296 /DNA_ID=CAMNT_0003587985 /DNA_START=191 /DNA_END=1081 /DNA_ORIENTATION=+
MNSPRANHFGNPLITATVGSKSNNKSPPSPVGSTFSTNEFLNSKKTSKESLEHLCLSFGSPRSSMPSSSSPSQHQALSPNLSFSEREMTSSQNDHAQHTRSSVTSLKLVGSTITTGPTIGLPSHYPGSAGHQRVGSLESSVLLEELQDFDDIFEHVQASTPRNSPTHHSNSPTHNDTDDENERNEILTRKRQDEYDEEDDLQSFARSVPSRLSYQHRRNMSELSGLSISLQPPQLQQTENNYNLKPRSNSWVNSSNHSSSSSTRSLSTINRQQRRSRNRALSSTEFQASVLDELNF